MKKEIAISEKDVINLAITSGFFLAAQTFMAGALQQVWSMINGMQLFVHVPMLGVGLPEVSKDLIDNLVSVATLDLLPTDAIYASMFPDLPGELEFDEVIKDEEPSLLQRLGSSGYESQYFTQNAGTLMIAFLALILFQLLLICLLPLCYACKCSMYNRMKNY